MGQGPTASKANLTGVGLKLINLSSRNLSLGSPLWGLESNKRLEVAYTHEESAMVYFKQDKISDKEKAYFFHLVIVSARHVLTLLNVL